MYRRENGEAVLGVERGVEVVLVDASHFHQLSGPRAVDQVAAETGRVRFLYQRKSLGLSKQNLE